MEIAREPYFYLILSELCARFAATFALKKLHLGRCYPQPPPMPQMPQIPPMHHDPGNRAHSSATLLISASYKQANRR